MLNFVAIIAKSSNVCGKLKSELMKLCAYSYWLFGDLICISDELMLPYLFRKSLLIRQNIGVTWRKRRRRRRKKKKKRKRKIKLGKRK